MFFNVLKRSVHLINTEAKERGDLFGLPTFIRVVIEDVVNGNARSANFRTAPAVMDHGWSVAHQGYYIRFPTGKPHASTICCCAALLPCFLRSFSVSDSFRRRMLAGVTSTNSSSSMYSRACSRVIFRAGFRMMFSSRLVVRMLVSCLALVGLTTMSSSRQCSPQTWPS